MTSNAQLPTDPAHQGPQVLLIANRTCECPDVLDTVRDRAGADGHVHVVVPALNSRLRHYVSDTDEAFAAAQDRLEAALTHLRDSGVAATGVVGDSDPFTAVDDVLVDFPANEFVVSTYPKDQSNWLERDLPTRLGDRFGHPVTHIVSQFGLVRS